MQDELHAWDPVVVFSSFYPADILAAKMELEGADIRYQTANESFGGLYPGCDGMATIDLLVNRPDAQRARRLLAPLNEGRASRSPSTPQS